MQNVHHQAGMGQDMNVLNVILAVAIVLALGVVAIYDISGILTIAV